MPCPTVFPIDYLIDTLTLKAQFNWKCGKDSEELSQRKVHVSTEWIYHEMEWSLSGSLGRHLFPQSSPHVADRGASELKLPGSSIFQSLFMDLLLESFRAAPVKQEHVYLMHIIQASLQQHFVIQLSNITKLFPCRPDSVSNFKKEIFVKCMPIINSAIFMYNLWSLYCKVNWKTYSCTELG